MKKQGYKKNMVQDQYSQKRFYNRETNSAAFE